MRAKKNICMVILITLLIAGCDMGKSFMINNSGRTLYVCIDGRELTFHDGQIFTQAPLKDNYGYYIYISEIGHINCQNIDEEEVLKIDKKQTLIKNLYAYERKNKTKAIYTINPNKTFTLSPYDTKQKKILHLE